ncbi:MAG: PEP-CTERM sorting domain-containing protein [Candidatus Spyradosoma sp.]
MKNTKFRSRRFFFRASALAAVALPLAAVLAPSARAETVWAKGVSWESGWFDQDKVGALLFDDEGRVIKTDSFMCWAAASSNIIAWWQAQAPASAIPDVAPSEQADIYEAFTTNFKNVPRGAEIAWRWYFGGCNLTQLNYTYDFENGKTDSGRYWEDYVNGTVGETSGDSCPSWIIGEFVVETYGFDDRADKFAGDVSAALSNGYGVALSLTSGADGSGHSITLWGLEREGDLVTKIYITDSDDAAYRSNSIFACEVEYKPTEESIGDASKGETVIDWTKTTIWLKSSDYDGFSYYINAWSALALPVPVPEPSAFALIAGLLGGGLAAARRRRRKA